MGALPRPDIPPGPQRDLVAALHELHHHAGWPSLRTLAREAGCSHTTVSNVFSSPRLPGWGVLELLVEAMDGDTTDFHHLWLACGEPASPSRTAPDRIAGRRDELAAVRRHLEAGTGLLLVTGEAGIGKTKLVDTARAATDVVVARGNALPLSTAVSLLPVATALRDLHGLDGGEWMRSALVAAPSYVTPTLGVLLPEIEAEPTSEGDSEWARHRLFSAIRTALTQMANLRPLALLVEDLHWADLGTLELFEHLLTGELPVPIVGTYRLDDPSIPDPVTSWFDRVRRLPGVHSLDLGPLTRDETAAQVAMVSGPRGADEVERIYARSLGQPLFTEQLAAHADAHESLPRLLADVLDRRLDDLEDDAHVVVRALGVADRPLHRRLLLAATALDEQRLTGALRDLDRRRLLARASDGPDVALRHPLLGEAARRSLPAGEAPVLHAALARALAVEPSSDPAEVAHHWELADQPDEELVWRIRAARDAEARFAAPLAAEQWERALDLWHSDDLSTRDDTGLRRIDAEIRLLDAYRDAELAEQMASRAETLVARMDGLSPVDAAEVAWRAALCRSQFEGPAGAEALAARAIELFGDSAEPGLPKALRLHAHLLRRLDRTAEASELLDRCIEVCRALDDHFQLRRAILAQSFLAISSGSHERARSLADEAASIRLRAPDPRGDLLLATHRSDAVLKHGGGAEAVLAVGGPVLESLERWGLQRDAGAVVRSNMARVLLQSGHVDRAAGLIDEMSDQPLRFDHIFVHATRCAVDIVRGRPEEAALRLAEIDRMLVGVPADEAAHESAELLSWVELWTGRPEAALERLLVGVERVASMRDSEWVAESLALAARAAADQATRSPGDRAALRGRLLGVHASLARDPFGSDAPAVFRNACKAAWEAELTRLAGSHPVEAWTRAASEWDRIERPFDAAYCRWRGAQAALLTGQGTVAQRFLQRAARDAHCHVPLVSAIRQSGHAAR